MSPCLYSWMHREGTRKLSKYCFRLQVEKVFLHFPTACKEMLLFWPFWTENRDFFPWCSPDALLSSRGTMTTLEHPAGAPQLGIPRIVLDIFGFHQSKWLQFSIKMLILVLELSGQGRKYEAVPLDDKWPSFDWANREIRATVYWEQAKIVQRLMTHGLASDHARNESTRNIRPENSIFLNLLHPQSLFSLVWNRTTSQVWDNHWLTCMRLSHWFQVMAFRVV